MYTYLELKEGSIILNEQIYKGHDGIMTVYGNRVFREYIRSIAKRIKSADIYIGANWTASVYIRYVPRKLDLLENSLFLQLIKRYAFDRGKIIDSYNDDILSILLIAEKFNSPGVEIYTEEQFNEYLLNRIYNGKKEFKFEVKGDLKENRRNAHLGTIIFSTDYIELI